MARCKKDSGLFPARFAPTTQESYFGVALRH